jgi:hypothetical protein
MTRIETAAECCGCGAIVELEQNSDYCWACTYPEPICLCAGDGWRTTYQDRQEDRHDR